MLSAIAALTAAAALATGVVQAVVDVDALVMTEAEHDEDMLPIQRDIAAARVWQKCDRWERRIEELQSRFS